MPLSIGRDEEPDVSNIIVDRRLWLNGDGKVVEDGDPSAATLWAIEGREVPAGEAERVGYKPKPAKKRPVGKSKSD